MSKKRAPTSNPCDHEGSEYVFRLDVPKLLEAAARVGDTRGAVISRRTGIAESSVSRILRGEAQPDLNSAMRIAETYDIDLRDVIKRVPIEAAA
ncbi:helix-turn-helix domain-containing protein [Streptomyces acidicola]|uniref:helix-turn-helix domain-containing protein n=1 Tax=Streptomyces acidicola TaxID=2596892 RepID=UPI0037AFA0C6